MQGTAQRQHGHGRTPSLGDTALRQPLTPTYVGLRRVGLPRMLASLLPGLASFTRSLPSFPPLVHAGHRSGHRSGHGADTDPVPRALTGLGLVAAVLLSVFARRLLGAHGAPGALVTVAALWLTLWAQLTAALLRRARLGWPRRMVPELFALLAVVGLGVTAVLIYAAGAAGAMPAGVLALRVGALAWLLGLAAAVTCNVVLGWRFPVLARWIGRQRDALLPAAAYGTGLGLLALTLALRFGGQALAGAGLLAALLVLSEVALQALLAAMRVALRRYGAGEAYVGRVRRWLLAYAMLFALVPGVFGAAGAAFSSLSFGAAAAGLHFALLGATVALASVALALRQGQRPAGWMLAAGGLAVVGVPAGLLLTAMFTAILLRLLVLSQQVPRHAVLFL